MRLTVSIDTNSGREGGKKFYINDDTGDGCSNGPMRYQYEKNNLLRKAPHDAPRSMTPVTASFCLVGR